MSDERRQFRRFNVAHSKLITGRMDRRIDEKQLVMFGGGGCGFYSPSSDPSYQPVKRVFCRFELISEEPNETPKVFEIQGNLVYLKTLNIDKKEIFFYGVEFLEAHKKLVEPIIAKLEVWEKEGKVVAA